MLNKQVNDPDVAGVGQFVEENFYNLGLTDHPLQALNRVRRNQPNFRDDGRKEITGRDSDAFKFRVLTLRQLKDARFFFHNGSFTTVKDVVRYFNAGVPQDAEAAAAGTLTTRFTHPRGTDSRRGLGLSPDEVDDLTDFIENGLYDPALVRYDPDSTTRMFQLSPPDFLYSVYRPDLVAAGNSDGRPAVDGRPLSGLPQDNDDALSRRDMGLEFLDVTGDVQIELIDSNVQGDPDHREGDKHGGSQRQHDTYRITNNSASVVDTHLLMVARGLSFQVEMENASGRTSTGEPYRRVFLRNGVLQPGQSIVRTLRFKRDRNAPPVSYTLKLLSGQGSP
jgi:hypothetical protein